MEKGKTVELKFVDLTYEGLGVAKHDGLAIFVKGALPGVNGITATKHRYRH